MDSRPVNKVAMTINGYTMNVTVHGNPHPVLLEKAWNNLIGSICRQVDEEIIREIEQGDYKHS